MLYFPTQSFKIRLMSFLTIIMEISRIRTPYAQESEAMFGSNWLFGCVIYCPRTNINLSHGFEAPSKSSWFKGGYFKI